MGSEGQLDKEIESWKGFPWALRKEDLDLWNRMIDDVRDLKCAIEDSGKPILTDAFFMGLLLVQFKIIKRFSREVSDLRQ